MLPKSRRALTIQEIAALARSSLHGKDHSFLTDLRVAEQFAIAEAKLRAWSSVDGDESNDDSYDEDFLPANEPVTQSTDYLSCCADLSPPVGSPGSPGSPSDTLCSSMCSLDERHPLLRDLGRHTDTPAADITAKILGALQGGEELLLARLHRAGHRRGHSPCCLETFSETFENEDMPCKDCGGGVCLPSEYSTRRKVSDVASSGIVSLDEEDVEEEEREEQ
uniref:Zgc:165508 n=1 Tax=Cyprinus carpio TaxID=7962 RepID=A0A8C2PQQ5_CYPCA